MKKRMICVFVASLLCILVACSSGTNVEMPSSNDTAKAGQESVVGEMDNDSAAVGKSLDNEVEENTSIPSDKDALKVDQESITTETTVDGTATVESSGNETAETEVTTYKASTYKVGSDIPAGEYVLFNNSFFAYFEINKDSSGSIEAIIANDNFDTNSIVSLSDGQYFTMTGCYAVPIAECKEIDSTSSGMFKVGYHIPAGEYKVEIDENSVVGLAYLEVSTDSTHNLESITANDNFEGSKYITVDNGQYLKLVGCHIVSRPLQFMDLNIDKRAFIVYLLKDDFDAHLSALNNVGDEIGMWEELSATYDDNDAILDAAKKDLDAYLAQEECAYDALWEMIEALFNMLESGEYEDAVGTDAYQEFLAQLASVS